jgi:hypothetical protein
MNYDLSIPGWMEPDELQWLYDRASEMDSVVEIGCYQGRSTFALLQGCKGPVYAVDPWIDIMRNGSDNLALFLANLCRRLDLSAWRRLIPVLLPSAEAALAVDAHARSRFDMVFIDGDHSYESVKQDIELWLPKTRKLICGHDFGNPDYPGVEKAVVERFGDAVTRGPGLIWSVRL